MKKTALTILAFLMMTTVVVAQDQKKEDNIKAKVEQYAVVPLKYDIEQLDENERELVSIFIDIARLTDEIYWEQTFGNDERQKIRKLDNPAIKRFAEIQYGAWDRLDGNKPFIPGYKDKPEGACFYPANMTKEEFDRLDDPQKTSPYTIIRRGEDKKLYVIPYSKAYEKYLRRIDELLDKAIELAENPELREYLLARREALHTDDYTHSDMAWMKMKNSRLDFVFGPIESYEDALFGYKTSFESFVLIKDEKWSSLLEQFTKRLPEMQEKLPCKPEYKREKPGTESDINVYDVVYYAGECNAASKTIAINLPNDEKVQLEYGTRRLQLKNAMQAKYDNILMPIAELMIDKSQLKNVKFEAFFNNVCFHEVAHGLGVKNVINGKGTVRESLKNQYSAWEEAKADICGLFLVQNLIEEGSVENVSIEDAYVTFMAGLLRSVRFGAKEAHGVANIMCFNFMQDKGAFTRTKEGRYLVDVKKMRTAIAEWASLILETEGNGDYRAAANYAAKNGVVRPDLQKDLKNIEKSNIPIDIVFQQGQKYLGLKPTRSDVLKTTEKAIDNKTMTMPSKTLSPSKKINR